MRIGLTGGIASGKSAVSRILRTLGAVVLDGDGIAREVVAPGSPGLKAVTGDFGPEMLDGGGGLNRKKLGATVFADREKLSRLNAILHPLIRAELEAEARAAERDYPKKTVVLDVPLLIECGWQDMADEVWLVRAPLEERVRRIMERDGLSVDEALGRIALQMTDEEKAGYASAIIENDGSLEELRDKVSELYRSAAGEK